MMSGTIQALDAERRRLDVDVYGIQKSVDVPADCRVCGRGGVGELSHFHAGDWVHVECIRKDDRLQARSLEIFCR